MSEATFLTLELNVKEAPDRLLDERVRKSR